MGPQTIGWWQTLVASGILPLLVLAVAVALSFYSSTVLVKSQEKRWRTERKERAYLQCLKLLWQSRCKAQEGSALNAKDFAGRMQTLQYVEPWLIVAGSYSSSCAQEELGNAARNLTSKIDLVRSEVPDLTPVDKALVVNRDIPVTNQLIDREVINGHGLPEEIDEALNIVIKHCRTELRVE